MSEIIFDQIKQEYALVSSLIGADEYLSTVQKKFVQLGGLCDAHTAALLVNNDLDGVLPSDKPFKPVKINTLENGSDIAIIAKVLNVAPIKEFTRKDQSKGLIANVTVADDTGTTSLSLWDEMTEMISSGVLKEGLVIEVTGIVRDGPNGLSVSVGKNDLIRLSDASINSSYPLTKVRDISDGKQGLFLEASVVNIGNTRTFQKKDRSEGIVGNITIGDETGKIAVTLWGDNVAVMNEIKENDTILIKNVSAKMNTYSKKVELQMGDASGIEKINKTIDYQEKFTDIKNIKPGSLYSIKGNIIDFSPIREFIKNDGIGHVGNIIVKDPSGQIRITLWGNDTEIIKTADLGDSITVLDAQAKTGFDQATELNVMAASKIILV